MDAIVFGATGFIGRALVAELLTRGQRVAAAVRNDTLTPWLTSQGVDIGGLCIVTADITRPLVGLPEVRDVYNAAGRFAFGLGEQEARATNVTGALNVLEWAATLPGLRRLVHISGYRVSATGSHPDYARLGAYEASKLEGDLAVRARADTLSVPLTIANPSTVIGAGQHIGLAALVEGLWNGRLPALPGGPDTFLPVVTIDYFVRFLAEIPASPAGEHYWVLDDTTPLLPELIGTLADHMGVRAPRRTVPAGLLRRLPRRLTGADPETLSFLSADRYPTASARAFASRTGLEMPPAADALRAWAGDLVAARFGAASPGLSPYGFHVVSGRPTWVTGERQSPTHVLLHGLPMNADVWAPLAARLPGPILAPDLPGLGRSAATPQPVDAWLADLMRPVQTRPALVAHSLACGPALRFAVDHPDRISSLVLVSPAFLQAPAPRLERSFLAAPLMRRMTAARLARALGVPEGPAVHSAAEDLRRPGVARRAARALRTTVADRRQARELLDRVSVPVQLIVGSADPLVEAVDFPVAEITGAGHYPQLTHPSQVAHHLGAVSAATGG
ncbi:alpha/beta fold hydrolase [Streptomyces nymphaeiformis]|uniref:Nucleoside-diphosphate-sugar epimerase/pimeloyl-ACP methyl ester carboxylesterase n=1 Tax=Streptomyces nymphaeiformis TaxID=2663842 RepID=A0A7W7U837_9ACTN|nr:alpha/beta fold hydrolase [Streptomyces nymphaeiformis]MBB4986770.1 nucleoside-diphosphate-sugar epimerase/pimeloyl-ACP methyl ester carboxylesterase [Streptomyces nymphaeiformis]